jgi:hypothetical protein
MISIIYGDQVEKPTCAQSFVRKVVSDIVSLLATDLSRANSNTTIDFTDYIFVTAIAAC